MKHFILTGLAAAAMMMVSCANEQEPSAVTGGGNVTFTAQLPGKLQSRAYGDGTTATRLSYALYSVEGEGDAKTYTNVTSLNHVGNSAEFSGLKATVNLNLVTGKTYAIVFWADALSGSPYTFNAADGKISAAAPGDAQDENRDAFFANHEFTVTGAINETIELRRPFAQINIGTNDFEEFVAGGGSISTSGLTVKSYGTLNLINNQVEGEMVDYAFAPSAFPDAGEVFPVTYTENGQEVPYKYLTMNYILMGEDKEVVDVTWTSDNAAASEVVFNSVPVQRNYRTNIYGALLTNPSQFNLEIMPGFGDDNDQDHNYEVVSNAAGFEAAFEAGKNILVPKDVVIDLPEGKQFELSDGQILALEGSVNTNTGYQFQVKDGVEATIKGVPGEDNIIKGKDNDVEGRGIVQIHAGGVLNMEDVTLVTNYNPRGWTIDVEGGTVNLKNVNVVCDNASLVTIAGSTVNIDGGNFTCTSSSDKIDGVTRSHNYSVRIEGEGTKGYIRNAKINGVQGSICVGYGAYCEIDGGYYTAAPTELYKNTYYALYAFTNGIVEVKSGYFKATKYAVFDGNNDTTTEFAAKISLFGGFYSDKGHNQQNGEIISLPEGYSYVDTGKAEYPFQVKGN